MSKRRFSVRPSLGPPPFSRALSRRRAEIQDERRYRVWVTPRRTARFPTLDLAQAFAGGLFHDQDHVVILEKLAPNGCWLQLDRLA